MICNWFQGKSMSLYLWYWMFNWVFLTLTNLERSCNNFAWISRFWLSGFDFDECNLLRRDQIMHPLKKYEHKYKTQQFSVWNSTAAVINRKWFHPYLHHMLYVLLEFCEAFFNGQQTLQSICLRVLKKVKMIGRLARKAIYRWVFIWNLPGQTCSICCRSISRAGLMICKWRRNFLTTFSKAFSRITCSKSRSCRKKIFSVNSL